MRDDGFPVIYQFNIDLYTTKYVNQFTFKKKILSNEIQTCVTSAQ